MAGLNPAGFFAEARRRRVFQVAAVYIVIAWVVVQVADNIFPGLGVPESSIIYVWMAAAIGLPLALFFGWRYDFVDGHVLRTAAVEGEPGAPIGCSDPDVNDGRFRDAKTGKDVVGHLHHDPGNDDVHSRNLKHPTTSGFLKKARWI